jgi:hypothetical protein
MRAKRQVRSVTCRACRLEPGCETQYIALTVWVIQELTCCCTMSRNDSVFLHLTALTFHLIAHYLTIQARQSRAGRTHACSFIAGHVLKTCLVLSLAVCILTVSIYMQARSQTMNTVGIASYSVGAYAFFRYIYIHM